MDDVERQEHNLMDMLPADWDKRPLSLAFEVKAFLQSVKDEGTHIDSGTDGKTGDLWVMVQGVEYYVSIRRSNNQLVADGVPDGEIPVTVPKHMLGNGPAPAGKEG